MENKKKDVKTEVKTSKPESNPNRELELLHEDNDKLVHANQELTEKNLRLQADLINYRNRKEKETEDLLKYANEDIVLELLPILDNFERAIKMDSANETQSKFLNGFKLVYDQVGKTLEHFEVKSIDALNKPFDPAFHQAVMVEEKKGVKPGIVIEVLQKGYLLKDKVIRPAMVKVSE